MSGRPRNLVAALVVVTAIFADQAAASAPALRATVIEDAAARIIDRLTVKFRSVVVPASNVYERRHATICRVPVDQVVPDAAEPAHRPSSPYLFRLPPPIA
jgi:hypothetical protein